MAEWEGLRGVTSIASEYGAIVAQISAVSQRLVSLRAVSQRGSGANLYYAITALGLAANALFASADTKCTLAEPPEDVETRPIGPDDSMMTRCYHEPSHCWNGQGSRVNCPQ
jgi:hypothetical protein